MTPEEFEAVLRARGAVRSEKHVQEYLWYKKYFIFDLAYAEKIYSEGKNLEYELTHILNTMRRIDMRGAR